MPWVRLTMTDQPGRALGYLVGDGYSPEWRTEIRTWLTPDDTLAVQLYWNVYTPGEGGQPQGEVVLHKDKEGYWRGVLPEAAGQWSQG